MDKRNWIQFSKELLIQKFHICTVNSQLSNLPFQCFHIAAAPYSGPLALVLDNSKPTQYTFPQNYDKSIIIFSSKGDSKKLIPFQVKERVIFFEFTQEQSLLIIFASGKFSVIDPYSGQIKENSYAQSTSKDRFLGAALSANAVFLMREKQLGIIQDIGSNYWEPLTAVKVSFQNPVFYVFNEYPYTKIIYLSRTNAIECYVVETQSKQVIFESQQLKENAKNLIGLSKKSNCLSLVFKSPFKCVYIKNNQVHTHEPMFELGQDKFSSTVRYHRYKPLYQMAWIGESAVFSNRKLMIVFNQHSPNLNLHQCRIIQEIDGVRMIGQQHSLYRVVPQIYKEIIEAQMGNKQALKDTELYKLHIIYQKYVNRDVIFMDSLHDNRTELQQSLKQIIQCGGLCLDMLEQVRLFRFAFFIKTYYLLEKDLSQTCLNLRIVNNLRYEFLNRFLTLQQFQHIRDMEKERLLAILLRYNMHYIADVIIGTSDGKQKIFLHWAKCKIEKDKQHVTLQQITNKFQAQHKKMKGTRIFSQIAKYCLDRGKLNLASSLIDFEEHLGRKIMVLLTITSMKQDPQSVQKLLEITEECNDSFLIFRVIQELSKSTWIKNQDWTKNLDLKPNLQRHYIAYLKETQQAELLKQYYLRTKKLEEMGLWALRLDIHLSEQQLRQKIKTDYQKLLPNAFAAITKDKKKPGIAMLHSLKKKDKTEISQNDIKDIKKQQQLQYAAQILFEKGLTDLALECILAIKSQKAYALLQRKGYFAQSIRLAGSRFDKNALEQIIEVCPPQLEEQAKNAIINLKKK